jgi:hypothetical protein
MGRWLSRRTNVRRLCSAAGGRSMAGAARFWRINSRRQGREACLRRLGFSPTQVGLRALVGAVLTAGSFLANQFAATRTQSLPAQAGSRQLGGRRLSRRTNVRRLCSAAGGRSMAGAARFWRMNSRRQGREACLRRLDPLDNYNGIGIINSMTIELNTQP